MFCYHNSFGEEGIRMTLEQAIKKYKLVPIDPALGKEKAKILNVDEVLYIFESKNKYAYVIRDGYSILLYTDERSLYTRLYKGMKIIQLTT